MKKKIIIIILLLLILCVAFFVVKEYVARNSDKDSLTTVESDILLLSEEYPTRILIYGEMLEFDSKIATEAITEITYDSLNKSEEYAYQLIVVNDLNGKNVLSDDEWKIINDVVKADIDINFLYLGDEQFDKIFEAEIVEKDITAFQDGDLSLGLFYEGKNAISVYGTYTSMSGTTQNEVCEAIIHEQAYSIRAGNE